MALSTFRGADGRFVTAGAGIEWSGLDVLGAWYLERGVHAQEYRAQVAEALAREMEAYAKENAPWQDRTGDARASLQTQVEHRVNESTVYLGYGSDIHYAYYLENFVYAGVSYAIIEPTIRYFEPIIWEGFR
jgi:hypothetical protein